MTRPLDREEAVESALNAHVVSGYFCSCGQTVNHAIRHVATAVLESLDEFEVAANAPQEIDLDPLVTTAARALNRVAVDRRDGPNGWQAEASAVVFSLLPYLHGSITADVILLDDDDTNPDYQRGWDDGWVARNTVPPAPPLIETLRKVADRAENRGLTEMAVALRQRADEWEAEDDHRD